MQGSMGPGDQGTQEVLAEGREFLPWLLCLPLVPSPPWKAALPSSQQSGHAGGGFILGALLGICPSPYVVRARQVAVPPAQQPQGLTSPSSWASPHANPKARLRLLICSTPSKRKDWF